MVPDMALLENMYLSEHTLSAGKLPIHKKAELARYEKQKELPDWIAFLQISARIVS
ncbi:MAG: hypothetical protein LUH42_08435 [Oscillospiraceae bacterium]|nr:hypothetical protein [Oscillospiraceae bacterium]